MSESWVGLRGSLALVQHMCVTSSLFYCLRVAHTQEWLNRAKRGGV